LFRVFLAASATFLMAAAGICYWVYTDAISVELAEQREAGRVRLSEASSRLRGQLEGYRALANLIAKDPKMPAALAAPGLPGADADLALLSLTYGAWRIELADRQGKIIATSDPKGNASSYAPQLITAALNSRLGYSIDKDHGRRLIRFSRGVPGPNATVLGVVIISADLETLEFEWPVTPEPVIFFNGEGVSMSANRPELLLKSLADNATEPKFPLAGGVGEYGTVLWQYQPAPGQKTEVQALSVQIPQLQMTGKILLDTGAAREIALLRLGLVSTLLIVLALAAAIFLQQRRRLALEARHSATLEQRVEERTIELRDTQNELVEASNLAALGRFSAGISHELNQPLAAILNFAENGKRYIKMSRAPEAGENLAQIADQVRRITRIIGNLRAFARQEHLPSERIDIVEVMRRTIDMMNGEIKSAGATVKTSLPSHPVYVMAGKVRLEQIVLNLLSNALDAMRTSQQKILSVELAVEDHDVRISVRDTGSGIDEPKRVFEPFYSTKQLGSSKGLGMGLALCFGLVTRFGGRLSCRNLEHGAEFVMTLPVHEAA
jgi:two-component system C4-dicarboxylate transport sensor histidine kinase DctB